MANPIPITEARKLLAMAKEDVEKAMPGEWDSNRIGRVWSRCVLDHEEDAAFIIFARAVMGPMVEYIAGELEAHLKGFYADGVRPDMHVYPVLAALMAHYDSVKPNWRSE